MPEPEFVWRPKPPTLEEVVAAGVEFGCEAYYWVRGWNYNRPVMARVTIGARRHKDGPMTSELRFQIPSSPEPGDGIWASDFEGDHVTHDDPESIQGLRRFMRADTWRPLEWAGPIPEPSGKASDKTPA